jgi:hypothetical protein
MGHANPSRKLPALLTAAAALLATSVADAAAISGYVPVQPILVCPTGPSSCPQFNNLGQTGPNAPVGFVDPATGLNITRAIFSQAGVDITFLPAVQLLNAGSLQTLHVTTDPATGLLTSTDFKTLSQQAGISQGAAPRPPLSPNRSTINLFFVNNLVPQTPGILYGFSWIGNNGVSIGASTFGLKVGSITLPGRPDTIAHEIGHDLDLDHTTFGAGASTNLMTAGNIRTGPSAAIVGGHAAWVNQIFPNGTLDQLSSAQQTQILKSGFLNPIPLVTSTVTDPPVGFDYHVGFEGGGRAGESLDKVTLVLPAGLDFSSGFEFLGGIEPSAVRINPSSCAAGRSCLELEFAPGTLVSSDFLDYSIGVCILELNACSPVDFNGLIGATYTYQFSDLFATTSALAAGVAGQLTANSQNPVLSTPSQIVAPADFLGTSAKPCTPLADGSCPPLVLQDADPREEGGQIPEPSTLALLAAGLAMFWVRPRSNRARP